MRLTILLILLWVFTACVSKQDTTPSPEKYSSDKILSNQADAQNARSEYNALQRQRTKE